MSFISSNRNQPQMPYARQYSSPPTHIAPPNASTPTFQSPLDQVRVYTAKAEDVLDLVATPIKPYLPVVGRLLIVLTFLEDTLRIVSQWSDQLFYIQSYRGIPWGFAHLFLMINVIAMVSGSFMIITRRRTEIAVGLLFCVIIAQALGYGLLVEFSFVIRNLSVIGGLLMVLSDSLHRRNISFAGLPQLADPSSQQKTYFQLLGRILLILLFIGFVRGSGNNLGWGLIRILAVSIGSIACIMVAVGFKAKWSAVILVAILSIFNVIFNNFWHFDGYHPNRDFLKYDFFQTLSIIGGLLLLVNMGAGGISIDQKKKVY